MKYGDQFSSYYDHIVYPTTLYGSVGSGSKCGEATIYKHLRQHFPNELGLFFCICCD